MKKLLLILLFTPLILFSQENVNDWDKEREHIEISYEITYYYGKPYTGVFFSKYENGQLETKTIYKEGKRIGLSEGYYENGQLKYKSNHKEGKRVGISVWYYENGQLETKTIYKEGKRIGLYEWYYENGQLKHKGSYQDDKQVGIWEYYYENGKLEYKATYVKGERKYNFRSLIGDTNIGVINVYDLEAMIIFFIKDCEKNGIKLSSDYKITSTFEPLNDGVLAKAYGIFNDEEITIRVNPKEWSNASNPKRWYIMYHELGHDVLNLKHGQGGKMMFNFTEEDYTWDDFFKDKDYMFNSMKRE
jgi:antitoxin component YwqK of YwqJK toxin-antitoxin module